MAWAYEFFTAPLRYANKQIVGCFGGDFQLKLDRPYSSGSMRQLPSIRSFQQTVIRHAMCLAVAAGAFSLTTACAGPNIVRLPSIDTISIPTEPQPGLPIDIAKPLSAEQVATIAVVMNPDLRALRQRDRVADAQVFEAGLLPDPSFTIAADFVLGGPVTAFATALAGALAVDLQALRTRRVTVAGAQAQAQQVRLDTAWAEWQLAGQARLLAARTQSLDRQLVLAAAIQALAADILERTQRASARADIGADRLQAARLTDFDASDQLRSIDLALAQARFDLARTLGLPPGTRVLLADAAMASPVLRCANLSLLARKRLDLKALEAGYVAQSAVTRFAILSRFPAPGLTMNTSRNESGNRFLGPSIALTLPLFNRQRGTIAVAEATADALRTEYAARLFAAEADIAALCATSELARAQQTRLAADVTRTAPFATASRRAANRGDLPRIAADNDELVVLGKQLQLEQLQQGQVERLIGLEQATGRAQAQWTENLE